MTSLASSSSSLVMLPGVRTTRGAPMHPESRVAYSTTLPAKSNREDLGAGLVMTLNADDIESLRAQLLAQASLDAEVGR